MIKPETESTTFLKTAVLDYLRFRDTKYPDDGFLIRDKKYSSTQIIKEIEADSPLGKEMVSDIVNLTIDLLGRGKRQVQAKVHLALWVRYHRCEGTGSRWTARADFTDLNSADFLGTCHGSIKTRQLDTLQVSIDTVLDRVKSLGIKFFEKSYLYIDNDYVPPHGWQKMLRDEANRIGFVSYYDAIETESPSALPIAAADDDDFLDM